MDNNISEDDGQPNELGKNDSVNESEEVFSMAKEEIETEEREDPEVYSKLGPLSTVPEEDSLAEDLALASVIAAPLDFDNNRSSNSKIGLPGQAIRFDSYDSSSTVSSQEWIRTYVQGIVDNSIHYLEMDDDVSDNEITLNEEFLNNTRIPSISDKTTLFPASVVNNDYLTPTKRPSEPKSMSTLDMLDVFFDEDDDETILAKNECSANSDTNVNTSDKVDNSQEIPVSFATEALIYRTPELNTDGPRKRPSSNDIGGKPLPKVPYNSLVSLTPAAAEENAKLEKIRQLELKTKVLEHQRSKVLFNIELIALLYIFSYALTLTLSQEYIIYYYKKSVGLETDSARSASECDADIDETSPSYKAGLIVQKLSSRLMTYLDITCYFPAVFATLLIGAFMDSVGRRIGLQLPILGTLFRDVLLMLFIYFELPVSFLFLANLLDGLSGGLSTMLMTCFTSTADVSTVHNKTVRIAIVEVVLAVGIGIAYVSSGYLIETFGFFIPLIISLVSIVLCFILASFHFKETLVDRRPAKIFSCNIFYNINNLYINNSCIHKASKLRNLLAMFFIISIVESGNVDVNVIYFASAPICFTPIYLGIVLFDISVVRNLGSLLILAFLEDVFPEVAFIYIGTFFSFLFEMWMSLARTQMAVYLASLVGLGSTLSFPVVRSIASTLVDDHQQGTLFASMAACQVVGTVTGSIAFNLIYANTNRDYPGLVYVVMAVVSLFVLPSLIYLHIQIEKDLREKKLEEDEIYRESFIVHRSGHHRSSV